MPKRKHTNIHNTQIYKKGTNLQKAQRAYKLFDQAERDNSVIEISDICRITGYKPGTVATYITKKWWWFLNPHGSQGYTVQDLHKKTEDEFLKMHKQKWSHDAIQTPIVKTVIKDVHHHWRINDISALLLIAVIVLAGITWRIMKKGFVVRWKQKMVWWWG